MPVRLVREGILTSKRVAQLDWGAEVFFRRLLSVVDDFGRYHADYGLLRAACYPRQLAAVSDADIGSWLLAAMDADLVVVYGAEDGDSYLQVNRFGQQIRAKQSKFPDPPEARDKPLAVAKRVPASAHLSEDVSVDVCEDVDGDDKSAPAKPARAKLADQPPDVPDDVWRDFQSLRKAKRSPLTATALEGIAEQARSAGMTLTEALRTCCLRGWQGFDASWLKQNSPHQQSPPRLTPNQQLQQTVMSGLTGTRIRTIDVEAAEVPTPARLR